MPRARQRLEAVDRERELLVRRAVHYRFGGTIRVEGCVRVVFTDAFVVRGDRCHALIFIERQPFI
jgi:hypothetical protein